MLKVKKVVRRLEAAEAGEGVEGFVDVWVNVSREHWQAYTDLMRMMIAIAEDERAGKVNAAVIKRRQDEYVDKALDWWAETWDLPRDELEEFHNQAPAVMWQWLTSQSMEMINGYREEIAGKKAGNGSKPGSTEPDTLSRE